MNAIRVQCTKPPQNPEYRMYSDPYFDVIDPPAKFAKRYARKGLDREQWEAARRVIAKAGFTFDQTRCAWVRKGKS